MALFEGYLYYVIFVDDHSRFTWFYPLKAKSEFYVVLANFLTIVQTQFSCKVKTFQSDGSTEFLSHRVHTILTENGSHYPISCPYTPQQNGQVERKHRHFTETGLSMIFIAKALASLWVDAFLSVTYIINHLPSKILAHKSPFELLFGTNPNYDVLRTFSCRVYPYLRDYSSHKLAPRNISCIFIGYNAQYKGYRCLDPLPTIFIQLGMLDSMNKYFPTPVPCYLQILHH